jgi:hypothetical protein
MNATVRTGAFALACLALAGCAQRYVWHREGAGPAAVEQARGVCKAEARRFEFLDGPKFEWPEERSIPVATARGDRYSVLGLNAVRREAGLFDDCMHRMGYARAALEDS